MNVYYLIFNYIFLKVYFYVVYLIMKRLYIWYVNYLKKLF